MAIKCLLIEDDRDDQEIFLLALQKVNDQIDCRLANNGVEGLAAFEDHSFLPDYIFVDINMPKMNGIECLDALRRIDRLKRSRIIMCSTSMDASLTIQCKTAGADDVLMKPPSFRQLTDSLQTILNSVQLQ
jgi:CheY-like chemotaxis protein